MGTISKYVRMAKHKRNEDKIGKLLSLMKRLLVIIFSFRNVPLCFTVELLQTKTGERKSVLKDL